MGSILLVSMLLTAAPPSYYQFISTPDMRIQQIIEQEKMNRAPRILPGTLPYPYPTPPSYPRPFENYWNPGPYYYPYQPYYQPYYYRPYYHHYWP